MSEMNTDNNPTGGDCICVFCLYTFCSSGIPQDERVARRIHLIEFCKQLTNDDYDTNQTPDELNFFARLEEQLMERRDITLCVECFSDVATVVKGRQDQRSSQVVIQDGWKQYSEYQNYAQKQQHVAYERMANISEKIERANGGLSAFTFLTLDEYGKRINRMREKIVEVVRNPQIPTEPFRDQASGHGNTSSGSIQDANKLSVHSGSHVEHSLHALPVPSSTLSTSGVIPPAREELVNLLYKKRPVPVYSTGATAADDENENVSPSPPKKAKGSAGNEPLTFKKWIVTRWSKNQGNQRKRKATLNGNELPSLRYCEITDKLHVGSVEVRINEEKESLECTATGCNYISYQPVPSTSGNKVNMNNPYMMVENKLIHHVRLRHLNLYDFYCKFCEKGFTKKVVMQAHEEKCTVGAKKKTRETSDVKMISSKQLETGEEMKEGQEICGNQMDAVVYGQTDPVTTSEETMEIDEFCKGGGRDKDKDASHVPMSPQKPSNFNVDDKSYEDDGSME